TVAAGDPGIFHRTFGFPLSSVGNPSGYKNQLQNDQRLNMERRRIAQTKIQEANGQIKSYQTNIHEHEDARKWAFCRIFLNTFIEHFNPPNIIEEHAMPEN